VAGPVISAIVVNYRRPDILGACLTSLQAALDRTGVAAELIVVDNASGDTSLDVVAEVAPQAIVLQMPSNLGFPTAVMEGVRRSAGEWVLLINNDVIVEPDAVSALLTARGTSADVGSLAAQMRFAGDAGTINSAGIGVDRLGIAFDRLLGRPVSESETEPVEVFGACCGAAMLRRAMLDDIGGMDESFFFALDDADLAWRAQMRGWRCLYVPARWCTPPRRHRRPRLAPEVLPRRAQPRADGGQERRRRAAAPLRPGDRRLRRRLRRVRGLTDRTLAPLRGRVQGLREWPRYRRPGGAAAGRADARAAACAPRSRAAPRGCGTPRHRPA
jgi:glycosyltransferase involved in cell wall biosynthesis